MNVGPRSCASCAPMWSCGNRSSNRSWPDWHTNNSHRLPQAGTDRPARPHPAGRVPAHLPDPRPGGLKVARRKTQKNDNMLVFLFGLSISLFSLHENKWRSWRRAAPSKPKTKTRNNDNMLVDLFRLGVLRGGPGRPAGRSGAGWEEPGARRLDGLGWQAGFGWVAETRATGGSQLSRVRATLESGSAPVGA